MMACLTLHVTLGFFFFSSRRRHTRCALVAGVQTCALPISGEVDLVARRGGMHAFVEVKARATGADLDLAIDERRLSRVAAAAEILFHDLAKPGDDMRIDVMLLAPGRPPRHLANVWHGG